MSRRQVQSRRIGESASSLFPGSSSSKAKSSPILSIVLALFVGAAIVCVYLFSNKGELGQIRGGASKFQEGQSCTTEIVRAFLVLKKVYGDSAKKILHVGPETCSVVTELLKEKETEAWGVEPYDIEDADKTCKTLVQNGIVRVSDVKFPLPYRAKSFPLVIVSETLDYLSPRYLNKTLFELARVSADGVVIFAGQALETSYPGNKRAKIAEVSKFGRAAKLRSESWWVKYFSQNNLEQNEAATKKFEQAATKMSYASTCQVFHLMPFH